MLVKVWLTRADRHCNLGKARGLRVCSANGCLPAVSASVAWTSGLQRQVQAKGTPQGLGAGAFRIVGRAAARLRTWHAPQRVATGTAQERDVPAAARPRILQKMVRRYPHPRCTRPCGWSVCVPPSRRWSEPRSGSSPYRAMGLDGGGAGSVRLCSRLYFVWGPGVDYGRVRLPPKRSSQCSESFCGGTHGASEDSEDDFGRQLQELRSELVNRRVKRLHGWGDRRGECAQGRQCQAAAVEGIAL